LFLLQDSLGLLLLLLVYDFVSNCPSERHLSLTSQQQRQTDIAFAAMLVWLAHWLDLLAAVLR
jgi:hypothetical protein